MTYDSPAATGSPTGQWLDSATLTPNQMVHHAASVGIIRTSSGEELELVRWSQFGHQKRYARVQTASGNPFSIHKRELWWVWGETVEGAT